MLKVLHFELAFISVAFVANYFLAEEYHYKKEVEIRLIVVDFECYWIGIEQKFDVFRSKLIVVGIDLSKNFSYKNQQEQIDHK